jgi:hypothetical protein
LLSSWVVVESPLFYLFLFLLFECLVSDLLVAVSQFDLIVEIVVFLDKEGTVGLFDNVKFVEDVK